MKTAQIGSLNTGAGPLVVGTLTSRDSLPSACGRTSYPCDIVEVRLDLLGSELPGWLQDCQSIETLGFPVLLTLRLAKEGGLWTQPDLGRIPLLTQALSVVSCIDVEYYSESRDPLCQLAAAMGKPVVVSYHNFNQTPSLDELDALAGHIGSIPGAIPKISTMIRSEADVVVLKELIAKRFHHAICVIGMGAEASETRVLFPQLGSCFTYGYVDSSGAPGQLPAAVLRERLKNQAPGA